VPAARRRWYLQMIPRIQADETSSLVAALLATNGRAMKDGDRQQFLQSVSNDTPGATRRRDVPKVTPGFLRRVQLVGRTHGRSQHT
jgi:hypothetical protein